MNPTFFLYLTGVLRSFLIPNLRRHALSVVPSLPLRQVACTCSLARTLILTVAVWRPLALGFVNGEGEHRAFSS